MTAETWAKALTAMEAGFLVPEVLPDGMSRVVYDQKAHDAYCCGIGSTSSGLIDKPTPLIALAAACDALSLPWQHHPVWLMHTACEQAMDYIVNGGEWETKVMVVQYLQAALDAAKGGG